MKKIYLTLFGLFIGAAIFAAVFFNPEAIIGALKQADANRTSQYFDNFIDLKLPEKEEVKNMGKTQAGVALGNFFSQNNITGFELSSQRELGGTMYITGKLMSAGKQYNITLMLKQKGNTSNIITVRIS